MTKVLLKPLIFFDPAQTGWTSKTQFEDWFAHKLAESGLEGESIETIPSQEIVILIKAKPIVPMPNMPQGSTESPKSTGRPKSVKGQLESLKTGGTSSEERQFKKGKLLKNKGYLRK